MSELAWITGSGLAMSAIALVGSVTLLLRAPVLERLVMPLVAFAAGSLLCGAFFHMLPAALAGGLALPTVSLALMLGFTLIPEVNKHRSGAVNLVHFAAFVAGLALLWSLEVAIAP